MERLAERFSNGQAAVYGCGNNCKYDFKYCHNAYEDCPTINEIYEKLAVYEDLEEQTGISLIAMANKFLEFIKAKEGGLPAKCILLTNEDAQQYEQDKIDKEQGLLLKLPCKVGDAVYTIYSDEDGSLIEKLIVEDVSARRIWSEKECFDYSDIGKTVFLTQAEAEEALQKLRRE